MKKIMAFFILLALLTPPAMAGREFIKSNALQKKAAVANELGELPEWASMSPSKAEKMDRRQCERSGIGQEGYQNNGGHADHSFERCRPVHPGKRKTVEMMWENPRIITNADLRNLIAALPQRKFVITGDGRSYPRIGDRYYTVLPRAAIEPVTMDFCSKSGGNPGWITEIHDCDDHQSRLFDYRRQIQLILYQMGLIKHPLAIGMMDGNFMGWAKRRGTCAEFHLG